jgi:S1-C subfamily serine protease
VALAFGLSAAHVDGADRATRAIGRQGNSGSLPPKVLQDIKAATVFVKTSLGGLQATGSGFVLMNQGDVTYVVTNHHVIGPLTPGRLDAIVATNISLVFDSGTAKERSMPAEVVASDPERDLAVLKTKGVKDAPKALNVRQKVEYTETMAAYIVGFPFGEALATGKGNPAVTVNKGTVSSIRRNERGDIVLV